jgi:hypothetical protein
MKKKVIATNGAIKSGGDMIGNIIITGNGNTGDDSVLLKRVSNCRNVLLTDRGVLADLLYHFSTACLNLDPVDDLKGVAVELKSFYEGTEHFSKYQFLVDTLEDKDYDHSDYLRAWCRLVQKTFPKYF